MKKFNLDKKKLQETKKKKSKTIFKKKLKKQRSKLNQNSRSRRQLIQNFLIDLNAVDVSLLQHIQFHEEVKIQKDQRDNQYQNKNGKRVECVYVASICVIWNRFSRTLCTHRIPFRYS